MEMGPPKSAFLSWLHREQKNIKAQHPSASPAKVAKIGQQIWLKLDPSIKKMFEERERMETEQWRMRIQETRVDWLQRRQSKEIVENKRSPKQ